MIFMPCFSLQELYEKAVARHKTRRGIAETWFFLYL